MTEFRTVVLDRPMACFMTANAMLGTVLDMDGRAAFGWWVGAAFVAGCALGIVALIVEGIMQRGRE